MASPRDKITLRRIAESSWVRPFAFLILIIVLWDLTVRLFKIPPYLIPAPKDVIIAFWTEGDKLLAEAVPTTMATLGGFALSALFGIPMAMLIAGSRTVESYVYPLLVFSQSIPKVAVAPLFVVWFGFGMVPKVISAFLLGFFPVVVAGGAGLQVGRPGHARPCPLDEGDRWLQTFQMVSLPHACRRSSPASRCR